MTAYELAKELELMLLQIGIQDNRIPKMLRQQADRIAELEDRLSMYEIKDLDRGIIGKIGDSPIHDLVHRTTPQIKQLSDEEIKAIANNLTCTPDKNWNVLFAKAILTKASEK